MDTLLLSEVQTFVDTVVQTVPWVVASAASLWLMFVMGTSLLCSRR